MASNTKEPTEQARTVPNASGTPANVQQNPVSDRTIKGLEARRNGALLEVEQLSEEISKLQRFKQLEAELAQARRDVQHGKQRIKKLEDLEAERLSEEFSKLQRFKQLEAELAQARRDVQRGKQRIKELEVDRHQATREAQKALKKLIEELGS